MSTSFLNPYSVCNKECSKFRKLGLLSAVVILAIRVKESDKFGVFVNLVKPFDKK